MTIARYIRGILIRNGNKLLWGLVLMFQGQEQNTNLVLDMLVKVLPTQIYSLVLLHMVGNVLLDRRGIAVSIW